MGTLQDSSTGRRLSLGSRQVLGRSQRCDLRLREPAVSAEHAVLAWDGERWTLRDLGSRNGTFVDGQLLPVGERRALREGAALSFGDPDPRWVLVSAGQPMARARCGAEVLDAQDGVLALPSEATPEVLIYEDAGGHWVQLRGDEMTPAADQQEIEAGGLRWTLELPTAVPETTHLGPAGAEVSALRLQFRVSQDEEHVEMIAHLPSGPIALAPRAHTYALLTLARLRLKDAADDCSPAAQGWVHHDDLARMLALDPPAVNVQVFRARRQLAAAGVHDAAELVERRPDSRQLRIGVADLLVERV